MTLFPMDVPVQESAECSLAPGEVRTIRMHPGGTLTVTEGILWLTQEHDGEDHVLQRGAVICFHRRSRVVLQALRGAARYRCLS